MKRANGWVLSLSCVLAACGGGNNFQASDAGGTSGQAGQESVAEAGKSTTASGGKLGSGGKSQAGEAGEKGGEAGQDELGGRGGKAGGGEAGQDDSGGRGGTAGAVNTGRGGRTAAGGTTSRGGSSPAAGGASAGASEAGRGGENSAGHAGDGDKESEGGAVSSGGKTSTTGQGGAAGTADTGSGGTQQGAGGMGLGGATGTGGSGAHPPVLMGPCDIQGTFACNLGNKKLPLYCNSDLIWAAKDVCDGNFNCDSTSGVCMPIVEECLGREPNDQVCVGLSTLHVCGPDLVTVEEQACGANEACDSALGSCAPIPAECQGREPNEAFCAGTDTLYICGADLLTVEERPCGTNEACDPSLRDCAPIPVECQGREPNEAFCTGSDILHTCSSDLLTVDERICEGLCENGACAAPRCNDSKPETGGCNANQVCITAVTCWDPVIVDGMAQIPAGTYMMGSENGQSSELPVHAVVVGAFEMDVTEVTTAAYQDCVDAGSCTAAATGGSCNAGVPERSSHPINCVGWEQSEAYCSWVGKRLPTEEEWEYAARGTDAREYPWGSDAPQNQLCWSGGSAGTRSTTCAVGSFLEGASPFGVQDMLGNVWERTSSGWSVDYSASRSSFEFAHRGGSWSSSSASSVRAAYRIAGSPSNQGNLLGFRCAR